MKREPYCRFPLPVSHTRTPFTIRRSTAYLLAMACFLSGSYAAVAVVLFCAR